MTREIQLTQGKVALVDDEDFERINKLKWHATWSNFTHSFYAKHCDRIDGKTVNIKMHRYILNAQDGIVVDHINHNTLDNRRINLRTCTKAQNGRNRQVSKNKKLPYKNIYQRNNSFRVDISTSETGEFIRYIATFRSLEEAIQDRNKKLKELHKDFANP